MKIYFHACRLNAFSSFLGFILLCHSVKNLLATFSAPSKLSRSALGLQPVVTT